MHLIDTATDPITAITERGVVVGGTEYELDVLIFATGFDAMTGTLTNIDIVGREGITLRDRWARDGLRSNLGICVSGFPNFFMSLGPQTPYSNLVVPIQLGAQWLQRALRWAEENGVERFEATPESEEWWAAETERTGKATVMYSEGKKAKAWFLGDERTRQAGSVPRVHGWRAGLSGALPRGRIPRLRVLPGRQRQHCPARHTLKTLRSAMNRTSVAIRLANTRTDSSMTLPTVESNW